MIGSQYNGAPGPGQINTQEFVEVLASTDLQARIPGGVLLVKGNGVIKRGLFLGGLLLPINLFLISPQLLTVRKSLFAFWTMITILHSPILELQRGLLVFSLNQN